MNGVPNNPAFPHGAPPSHDAQAAGAPLDNATRDDARYRQALEFLESRVDYERFRHIPYEKRNFHLERMRDLLSRLGHAGSALPIVHIAGTKGKGSTSAMIAACLRQGGYRVGLFTSPHLDRVEQRIAIDGQPLGSGELIDLVDAVAPTVQIMDEQARRRGPDELGPTFFEITTAMALVEFERQRVDLAVLEVGMGGRLDSTNVCMPRVAAITSISLDHTKQLGNTLEAIAREKAGIIKPGVPVACGVTDPGPREVIRDVCRQQGARLVQLGEHFAYEYWPPRHLERQHTAGKIEFRWKSPEGHWTSRHVPLSLPGKHQAANAAVAMAVLGELAEQGWKVDQGAIDAALAGLKWPARVEVVARQPAVVVDAAHNAASVAALLDTLDNSFAASRRLLVFATTHDKDVRAMLSQLLAKFDQVVFTRYVSNPRGVPVDELAKLATELGRTNFVVCQQPEEAWAHVRHWVRADDLVVVTGSFFIAAEMRRAMESSLPKR